jgi:DNA polymerase-3 subunit epsilon
MLFWHSPDWDTLTYWALDLETSGLRPGSDQILSVGLVPVRSGVVRLAEQYYTLVRPENPSALSFEGLRAHHILPSELEHAPALAAVLPEIDLRLREGVLLLHFARLDLAFLRQAYRQARLDWPRPKLVDTVELMLKLGYRQQRFSPYPKAPPTALPEAREHLGLPRYRNHHALSDALATAELFLALRARLGAKTLRELR